MKALILAGGNGKRLGVKTDSINKCMLKINGRYLIEYSLDVAYKYTDEIVIVVGYMSEQISGFLGNEYMGKKITYVFQKEQRGMVDAIKCSWPQIGNSDFILSLADEILLEANHEEMIKKYIHEKLFCVCGVAEADKAELVKKTYSICVKQDTTIEKLVEKPEIPFNNFVGTGNCVFSNRFFKYIQKTPISPRCNEITFPDVIQTAIDFGEKAKYFVLCNNYVNVNTNIDFNRAQELFV